MYNFFVPIIILFTISCHNNLPADPPQNASCGENNVIVEKSNSVENILGQKIYWNGDAFPIKIYIDPVLYSYPEKLKALHDAVLLWNTHTNLKVFEIAQSGGRNIENTIWITAEPLEKNSCNRQILGLARRFYRTDLLGFKLSISYAEIKIHTGTDDDRLLSTMIHELGHALGLHHDQNENSVMYPYNSPDRVEIGEEDLTFVREMVLRR